MKTAREKKLGDDAENNTVVVSAGSKKTQQIVDNTRVAQRCSGQRTWNENPATAVRIPGRATIPLDSNLGQVVYTRCLPSFSAPRNWGTKGSFRSLSGYGD